MLRDADIRAAIHQLYAPSGPDTVLLDELPVCAASARVDVAVVNGSLSGVEIKSDLDRLDRLPSQVRYYSRVFDEVTLVCTQRHQAAAAALIPAWWGLTVAEADGDDVTLFAQRGAGRNPDVSDGSRLWLLTRAELASAAEGVGSFRRRANRTELYQLLMQRVEPSARVTG